MLLFEGYISNFMCARPTTFSTLKLVIFMSTSLSLDKLYITFLVYNTNISDNNADLEKCPEFNLIFNI
jgi:hypothetical protein